MYNFGKKVKRPAEKVKVEKAMAQIVEKNYAAELIARGIQTIKLLAIVFEGKEVWVREKTGN